MSNQDNCPTETAKILAGALPNMQRYSDKVVVVKYGGHAMDDEAATLDFARDIVLLKQAGVHPIVVHGGGPQIGRMLERLGIKSQFSDGLRITDKLTVEIAEMVLSGSINKSIVAAINSVGGLGVGISGKDGQLVIAEKVTRTKKDPDSNIERIIDLGFVGEPVEVNTDLLELLIESDAIPVIAPIGVSRRGQTFNINADTFAGAIAGAIMAERLIMLTDVEGVLDAKGALLRELEEKEARKLITNGTISGGMIPKVKTCLEALELGVAGVVILSGKIPHVCLIELLTEAGAGTLILGKERVED